MTPVNVRAAGALSRAAVPATVIGAAYLLTRLVLLPRFPPFFDEGTYSWWALEGFEHAELRFQSLAGQVQPFAIWLAMIFMKFGAAPLTAMRLDSFFAGIVTLTCVTLIGHRAGGRWTAVAAAGLYVLLPFFVVHDVVGILDPLVAATGVAALYLQLRLVERPRLDNALLLGVTFAVGVLTKPTGVYAIVLLPVSLLCFDWSRARRWRRLGAWFACAVLAVVMAVIGHLITKLSTYNVPLISPTGAAPRTTRSVGAAAAHPLRWALDAWPPLQHALLGYVTWPLLLLGAVGVAVLARRRGRMTIVLAIWALVPVLADLEISEEQYPRLILASIPPFTIFVAAGLVAAISWGARRTPAPWRRALPAAVVLLFLPALILDVSVLASPATAKYPGLDDWQYATGWPSGAPYAPLASRLRAIGATGPVTVVLSEQVSHTLQIDLRNDPRVTFLGPERPEAASAPYAVVNGDSLPEGDQPASLVPLATWQRPRGGDELRLLQRGVVYRGKLYSDPNAFRAALNLPDKDFDRFLSRHPRYYRWYHDVLG